MSSWQLHMFFRKSQQYQYFSPMITISQKHSTTAENTDQSTSLESSRRTYRRLQRSSSRNSGRSTSRQSDTDVIKNFYVKNICAEDLLRKVNKQSEAVSPKRKRQPTPCKSKRLLPSTQQPASEDLHVRSLESAVALSELQEALKHHIAELSRLTSQSRNKTEQIATLQIQLARQQTYNYQLTQKLKTAQQKVTVLEETLVQSEANLAHTKNNLEKIKKTIQENRANDLKKENDSYRRKIDELLKQNMVITDRILSKDTQIQQLDNQVKILKNKIDFQLSMRTQSMKEIYLQTEINRLKELLEKPQAQICVQLLQSFQKSEEEKLQLSNQVNKLSIQLNYIQRKHVEEVKLYVKNKSDELTKYKDKYKKLKAEFSAKKKQLVKYTRFQQNNKNTSLKSFGQLIKDKSINKVGCLTEETISRRHSISFELSPDDSEPNELSQQN